MIPMTTGGCAKCGCRILKSTSGPEYCCDCAHKKRDDKDDEDEDIRDYLANEQY
jgi:hypothetical protein